MQAYILYIMYDNDFYTNVSIGVFSNLENVKSIMKIKGSIFRVREIRINDYDDITTEEPSEISEFGKFTYYYVKDDEFYTRDSLEELDELIDELNAVR